ncbi:MAG: ABC transporter substrate-binding protein [SAR86 cluster bacterium]|uniref:ABC transporter substrate-binding protein n=1 Tax=SAR86 cluster bacterium TaxID=2030880 RepID=A0A2A5AIE4_9GAMM|nr:MAG: ABC transporter substrate-binding protein [SAR86 cluster bacterium]
MFFYYLRLSALSYRRNPVLSSLMVLAVAIGISSYMVIFTLNYVMGGNPIPQKSEQLFVVQMDLGNPNQQRDPPVQLTYLDATALFDDGRAYRQTSTSRFSGILEPDNAELRPFAVNGRGATADFFSMFNVPFLYGSAWDSNADTEQQQVVVLSGEMNERLFGGQDSVGEVLRLEGTNFQVVGVLDTWEPIPKFYDVNNNTFGASEEIYLPWSLIIGLELPRSGNTNCFSAPSGTGLQAFLNSDCVWIQYWVELRSPNEEAEYLDFINSYTAEQKALGRFEKDLNNHLYDVEEWMIEQEVLPDETQILSALATMLLAVCLLNTIGLLLSKFLGKSSEIGVRQALGASKGSLFTQHVIEAGFIGFLGGVIGLGLSSLGLEGVKILLGENLMVVDWIQLDMTVALLTIALAIGSTIIAGLYPIWRACNINPAVHLKTQ